MEDNKIVAKDGFVFQRIHDGVIFGNVIHLGVDFSTGVARQDKREYYTEINTNGTINN